MITQSRLDEETRQTWNGYWNSKSSKGRKLYDWVAEFYRRFLIRPTLNHFVRGTFAKDSRVLHAGCGSGQVDVDLHDWVKVTALDISPAALQIYRRENGDRAETVDGSIFALPFADGTFDGIYNLGVMEHFTEDQIQSILTEFRRVLKPTGKVLLFWPPEFGLSVLFFKALKWIFAHILGNKDIQFHPDEICRLRSREHGDALLKKAGFRLARYAFGARDLFTYAILVGEKDSAR